MTQYFSRRSLAAANNTPGSRILSWFPVLAFFNFVELTTIGQFSIRPSDILFVTIGILFIVTLLVRNRIDRMSMVAISLVGGFLLIASFGMIYKNGRYFDLPSMLRFTQSMVWGVFASFFIRSEKNALRLVYSIIGVGATIGLVGVYLYVTIPDLHRIAAFYSAAGGEGVSGQASFNELGAFCSFSVALAIGLALYNRPRSTVFLGLLLGALLASIGLIMTQSRSGLLALLVVLVLLFIPRLINGLAILKIRISSIWVSAVILMGAVIALTFLESVSAVNRVTESFQEGSGAFESALTRLRFWILGIEFLAADPSFLLHGHGVLWLSMTIGSSTLENFFLDTTIAYGFVGLLFVITFWVYPVTITWNNLANYRWPFILTIVTVCIGIVVGFFGNVPVDPFFGGALILVLYSSGSASLRRG